MKVKVLSSQELKQNNKVEPKILTPNYIKQLNEKISYNTMRAENRREIGKQKVLKRGVMNGKI